MQQRHGVPPAEAGGGERGDDGRRADRRTGQRTPLPGRDDHAEGEQSDEHEPVGQVRTRHEQHAGQHGRGEARPCGGGGSQREQPPCRDGCEHRIGGHRRPDRGRPDDQQRRDPACARLGAEGSKGREDGKRCRGGDGADREPRGERTAEPDPGEQDEQQQCPRRMSCDVRGPRVGGSGRDPGEEVLQQRMHAGDVPRDAQVLVGVLKDRAEPAPPVDGCQANQPGQARGEGCRQQLPPRQPSREPGCVAPDRDAERHRRHRARPEAWLPVRAERGERIRVHVPAGQHRHDQGRGDEQHGAEQAAAGPGAQHGRQLRHRSTLTRPAAPGGRRHQSVRISPARSQRRSPTSAPRCVRPARRSARAPSWRRTARRCRTPRSRAGRRRWPRSGPR